MNTKEELMQAGLKVLKILYPLLILALIYLIISMVVAIFAISKFATIGINLPMIK